MFKFCWLKAFARRNPLGLKLTASDDHSAAVKAQRNFLDRVLGTDRKVHHDDSYPDYFLGIISGVL